MAKTNNKPETAETATSSFEDIKADWTPCRQSLPPPETMSKC